MIPKVIHKIWISENPTPEKFKKYTDTWNLSDCDVWEWGYPGGEVNLFKNSKCVKWCIKNKNNVVLNHYYRYYKLHYFGGIYLDLDIEVVKPFDDLLNNKFVIGYESDTWINNAVMMGEAGSKFMKDCLDCMDNMDLTIPEVELETGPRLVTKLIKENQYDDVTVLPERYFSPHRWYQKYDPKEITPDTYCVHHFEHSWKKD